MIDLDRDLFLIEVCSNSVVSGLPHQYLGLPLATSVSGPAGAVPEWAGGCRVGVGGGRHWAGRRLTLRARAGWHGSLRHALGPSRRGGAQHLGAVGARDRLRAAGAFSVLTAVHRKCKCTRFQDAL